MPGGSRSGRSSSGCGGSGRGSSRIDGRLSEASDRISNRVSGRGQRSSEGGDQPDSLYGSDTSTNVLGAALAELIGTFILVFTGTAIVAAAVVTAAVVTAAVLQRPTVGPAFFDSLAVAFAFGFALTAIVAAIGRVSGAHVNSAVTLALAATRKFAWQYVPIYISGQLVGAILTAIAT